MVLRPVCVGDTYFGAPALEHSSLFEVNESGTMHPSHALQGLLGVPPLIRV